MIYSSKNKVFYHKRSFCLKEFMFGEVGVKQSMLTIQKLILDVRYKEMHENPKFNNQVKNRFIIQIMGDTDIYMPCRFPSGDADEGRIFIVVVWNLENPRRH